MPKYSFEMVAIHARWPAYPAGSGPAYALETLCCFPPGTHFTPIDDIDLCFLFSAVEYLDKSHRDDRFATSHHHIALWHDDLRLLRKRGWLSGFRPDATGHELRSSMLSFVSDADRRAVEEALRNHDWDEAATIEAKELSASKIEPSGLMVTPDGWGALEKFAAGSSDVHEHLASRISPLLDIGFHDTAIREAALFLETELARRTGTHLYGQQLVGQYLKEIVQKAGADGAFQRHLRSELRTVFKFVRNEFMHNLVQLDRSRCVALLHRISAIYEMLDEADQGVGSFQDVIS